MRKLIWLAVLLIALFFGWWALASYGMQAGTRAWLEDRRAEGWQADVAAIRSKGFPTRIVTVLDQPAFADPGTGVALEMPNLTLSARTFWPGDVFVLLPSAPIHLATQDAAGTLQADGAQADLNLHPGRALELENLSFISGPFRSENSEGGLFAGDGAELRMRQTEDAQRYDLVLDIGQFAPGVVPRRTLLVPESWPLVFDALRVDASIHFDRPWDLRALEDRRPQPQQIDLRGAEAHWGDIRLRVAGALDVNAEGVPEGELTVKAENWQAMLDVAQTAGLLPPDMRPTVESVLASLAAGTGRTNEIDVTLDFSGGLIRVGFLPLGPAPRLILR